MGRYLYSMFFYLILPLVILRLCYRASKSPAYARRVAERFGLFRPPAFANKPGYDGAIWVHSVSVGETIAAAPLVRQLQQRFPETPLIVTTMTPTGSERVKALFGDSVFHVYAPYDLPGSVKRFLNRVHPKLLIIMETELWPNTLHYCQKNNIPTVLANARLSEKSARGYQRFALLTKPMLNNLSVVAAQHKSDAARFTALGLSDQSVRVTGSIKFDLELSSELVEKAAVLKSQWSCNSQRQVVVAASTHEGEDEKILQAFKQVLDKFPQSLLVLVPRHPERFDKVVNLVREQRLTLMRRSESAIPSKQTQVFVGDTMGELLLFYGASDITFVGGSLVPHGGHNVLEPAAWGVPVITGASDFNFTEINRLLLESGGKKKAASVDELSHDIITLMEKKSLRESMGSAALSVVNSNRGSLNKLVSIIETLA